jgi:hypothetical protein
LQGITAIAVVIAFDFDIIIATIVKAKDSIF